MFHTSQVKNVYVSDGNNLQLARSEDITGSNKITYAYAGGKMTSITDTQGRVVTFGYTATPNPTQPTHHHRHLPEPDGHPGLHGPQGALSSVTDATGAVTTWAYDGNGKVSRSPTAAGPAPTSPTPGRFEAGVDGGRGEQRRCVRGVQLRLRPGSDHCHRPELAHRHLQFQRHQQGHRQILDGLGHANASQFNAHGDVTSAGTAPLMSPSTRWRRRRST